MFVRYRYREPNGLIKLEAAARPGGSLYWRPADASFPLSLSLFPPLSVSLVAKWLLSLLCPRLQVAKIPPPLHLPSHLLSSILLGY